jgi:hypothetical protein
MKAVSPMKVRLGVTKQQSASTVKQFEQLNTGAWRLVEIVAPRAFQENVANTQESIRITN